MILILNKDDLTVSALKSNIQPHLINHNNFNSRIFDAIKLSDIVIYKDQDDLNIIKTRYNTNLTISKIVNLLK